MRKGLNMNFFQINKHNQYLNKGNRKQDVIPTLIVVIFFILYFINTLSLYNIRIGQLILLLVGMIGYLYTLQNSKRKENIFYIMFFLLYTILGLISFLIIGNATVYEYMWPMAYGGIAIVLLNYNIRYNYVYILYYGLCAYYIFSSLGNKMVADVTGVVSRNNLSVTILMFFSLLCVVSYKQDKEVRFSSVVLGLLLSLWAVGRSGILTFSIIFIGYIIIRYKGKKLNIKSIVMFLLFAITLYVLRDFIYKHFIEQAKYNYEVRGLESSRKLIWQTYIKESFSSVAYFFFGYPLENELIFTSVNGNLHNSFLHLHSRYGIFITLFFSSAILTKIFILFKKKKYLFSLIFIAIFVRINFDLVALNGGLDIFIYYMIFEGKYNKKIKES